MAYQEESKILQSLADLEHLASTLNARQHAGLEITPIMWSKLFQACAEAKAVIYEAREAATPAPKHPADGLGEIFTSDEFNQSIRQ